MRTPRSPTTVESWKQKLRHKPFIKLSITFYRTFNYISIYNLKKTLSQIRSSFYYSQTAGFLHCVWFKLKSACQFGPTSRAALEISNPSDRMELVKYELQNDVLQERRLTKKIWGNICKKLYVIRNKNCHFWLKLNTENYRYFVQFFSVRLHPVTQRRGGLTLIAAVDHIQSHTHTHTHTIRRTPLNKESVRRRMSTWTTQNIHNGHTSMLLAVFKVLIPAKEWPQNLHVRPCSQLDRPLWAIVCK